MNISRNKSEISSRRLANEATVFTVKRVQRGIEQRQTGLGRPGWRPVTPTESRPLVHRRRVGSYFHALDATLVLLVSMTTYHRANQPKLFNRQLDINLIDTIALIINYVFMVRFFLSDSTHIYLIYVYQVWCDII